MPATDLPIARLPMADGRFLHLDLTLSSRTKEYALSCVPFLHTQYGIQCDLMRDLANCTVPLTPPVARHNQRQMEALAHGLRIMLRAGKLAPQIAAKITEKGGLDNVPARIDLHDPAEGGWIVVSLA
jgi:hypothetical protein